MQRLLLPEHTDQFVLHDRFTEIIALNDVAARYLQEDKLLQGLNALRRNLHAALLGKGNGVLQQAFTTLLANEVHKGFVEFDIPERNHLQACQR